MKRIRILLPFALLALLSACGSPKPPYQGVKIGKPYMIAGRLYVPRYTPDYDETGIASWYGPGFHGGHTASGERYNQDDLTAAHKTLPLPSMVRVTNLDNGRSAILRINDRGPFASGRIIDLSRASAVKLGIYQTGTAKVRVQFLDKETREYVSNLPNGPASLAALDRAVQVGRQGGREDTDDANLFAVADDTANVGDSEPLPFTAPLPLTQAQHVEESALPSVEEKKASPIIRQAGATPPASSITATEFGDRQMQRLNTDIYIQAGTFGMRENAERMKLILEEMGSARIVETAGQKTMYRVLAGPYNSRLEAENMLGRFDNAGIAGAKIVRN